MKKVAFILVMLLLTCFVFSCEMAKGLGTEGVPELKEVKQSEALYGQDKETVLHEYELSKADAMNDVSTSYLALKNLRFIGGLSFMYKLAFNEPECYTGQDLEYIGEPGSTEDEEIVKSLKSIYQEMQKKYGEPENDDSVVIRKHLSDWTNEDPGRITYSTYDIWHPGKDTTLAVSVGTLEDRVIISLKYRQNGSIQLEAVENP